MGVLRHWATDEDRRKQWDDTRSLMARGHVARVRPTAFYEKKKKGGRRKVLWKLKNPILPAVLHHHPPAFIFLSVKTCFGHSR